MKRELWPRLLNHLPYEGMISKLKKDVDQFTSQEPDRYSGIPSGRAVIGQLLLVLGPIRLADRYRASRRERLGCQKTGNN